MDRGQAMGEEARPRARNAERAAKALVDERDRRFGSACEVLSPSTAALDRTRKWHHYAEAAVRNLWFLDPGPRTLELYQWTRDAGD